MGRFDCEGGVMGVETRGHSQWPETLRCGWPPLSHDRWLVGFIGISARSDEDIK